VPGGTAARPCGPAAAAALVAAAAAVGGVLFHAAAAALVARGRAAPAAEATVVIPGGGASGGGPAETGDAAGPCTVRPGDADNTFVVRAARPAAGESVRAADAAARRWVAAARTAAAADGRAAAARAADRLSRALAERAALPPPPDPAGLAVRRAALAARLDRTSALRDAAAVEAAVAEAAAGRAATAPTSPEPDDWERVRRDRRRAAAAGDDLLAAAARERTASARDVWGELGAGKTDGHRDAVLARLRLATAEAAVAAREAELWAAVDRDVERERAAARSRARDEALAHADAARARLAAYDRQAAEAAAEAAAAGRELAAAAAAGRRGDALDREIADQSAAAARQPAGAAAVGEGGAFARVVRPAALVRDDGGGGGFNRESAPAAAAVLGSLLAGGLVGGGLALRPARRRAGRRRPRGAGVGAQGTDLARPRPAGGAAVALLGTVPDLDAAGRGTGIRPPLDEALRAIRSRLLGATASRVVHFAAATRGAGTTSVVAGVAASLAAAGRTVLLVDANPFEPMLAARAGVAPSPGLVQLAEGEAGPFDCVRPVPGLALVRVLPMGDLGGRDPRDLLDWAGLNEFVRTLGDGYDHVLVDCPAYDAHPDAMTLLRGARAIVAVVGREADERGQAEAVASLRQLGPTLIGLVLNRQAGDTPPTALARTKILIDL
jgi:Mrp family chromosome partitioning ATPase